MRLLGQGEMHLRVAVERLASRFQVGGRDRASRAVAYCETIRGRHPRAAGTRSRPAATASSAT